MMGNKEAAAQPLQFPAVGPGGWSPHPKDKTDATGQRVWVVSRAPQPGLMPQAKESGLCPGPLSQA